MTLQATRPASRMSVPPRQDHHHENLALVERALSVGAGGWLMLRGLQRGGITGASSVAVGTMFVKRGATGFCPVYNRLGIDTQSQGQPTPRDYEERAIHVARSFTINRSANELFAYWRNFSNLPTFMRHLESVEVIDDKHSRWTAKAPAGQTISWQAEIISEEPDRLIAWKSVEGSSINHRGSVRFVETGERGTEVRVVLDYLPPLGRLGAAIAKLFGEEPGIQIKEDLRRFKQLMETGEIATNKGPHGNCRHSNHFVSE